MAANNGGPAFPQPLVELRDGSLTSAVAQDSSDDQGMSLRDYFAAKALNGILASDSSVDRTKVDKRKWASVAYAFADAMLAERER